MSRTPTPPPQPREIRIVIADDHAIVRDGLRAIVEAAPGLRVIGEAADGEEAWQRACDLLPDVLLLDLSMPVVSGLDAAERIAHDCPQVRIIALTMHEERGYLGRALRSGAAGYVPKRAAAAELVRAIRAVAAGETYVEPSLAGALLADRDRTTRRPEPPPSLARLTARETDVLRLVARGHSNKEIAGTLDIGVKTVETHKANGLGKLGLRSRAALVRFGIDVGWLGDTD